ncbi:MAG: chalcone isomerase family protein [Proteobacteria bacterium]|nr:chalcone isomerase family protein [Pseudomonadota bacterium]
MKRLVFIALAILLVISTVDAKQVGDVILPDSLMAGQDFLLLNGAGFRKKIFIKVYAGGLYLKQKMSDARRIIDADEAMAIRMHFIYDGVSKEKLIDGWNEGFNNNTGGNIEPIKAEIEKFNAFFTEDARKNDVYDIIYVPGQGINVYIKGKQKGTVTGLDFKRAVFSIWLGEKPADASLKKKMLGE